MFRFETVGVSLVIACLVSGHSFAADSGSGGGTTVSLGGGNLYGGCEKSQEARLAECKKKPTYDSGCVDKAENDYVSCAKKVNAPKCDTATDDYNKAKSEFSAACSGAQIPSSTAGGHIACSETLKKCSPTDGESSEEYGASSSTSDLYDLAAEEKRMRTCKLNAVTNHEGLAKDIKEARERKKDLKEKIPDIEQQITDAQQKATEDAEKIQQEEAQEAKEHAQKMREAKKALQAEQNGILDKVTQLNAQLDALEEQIGQIGMQKAEANNKYEEALMNIDMGCQSTALQQVAKLQELELARIRDRKLPNHTFDSLMKRVGVSNRQAWQRVADDRWQLCMNSRSVKQTTLSAKRTRNTLLENADVAIANIEKRKTSIRQQILQEMPKDGCPNVGQMIQNVTAPKACQAVQDAIIDQNLAEQEHRQKINEFFQRKQTASMNYSQNQGRLARKLADAQSDLNEEQNRLTNLERYLSLKKKIAGGTTNVDTKEMAEVRAKYAGLLTAAANYNSRCCRDTTYSNETGTICEPVNDFVQAQNRNSQADTAAVGTEMPEYASREVTPASRTEQRPHSAGGDGATPRRGRVEAPPAAGK